MMSLLLGVLLGGAVAVCLLLAVLLLRAQHASDRERSRGDAVSARAVQLEQELTPLRRYQAIVDVELAARQLQEQAAAEARRVVDDAQRSAHATVEHAQAEAQRVLATAQAGLATATMNANSMTVAATNEARTILEAAHRESERANAEMISASAEKTRLEKTAQAMRNVIDGYGDRYVVPTAGLLDDLAEEFSFTDAGQKLKAARTHTRDMIRNGIAAECDYVEANRRATAIEFVVDAFNGKADSCAISNRSCARPKKKGGARYRWPSRRAAGTSTSFQTSALSVMTSTRSV
jgi:hypothetical protein